MDIGLLRSDTLPQVITEVVEVLFIGDKRTATLPQVITEIVNVVQFWPDTITLKIGEQEVMSKVEVDIGLIPATTPPITKVNMVDCWIFQEILLLVVLELGIYPRLATLSNK